MVTNNCDNFANPVGAANGGTGLATITSHSVMVGEGTSAITPITVGANNSICMGNTGADPGFTTSGTPYVTGISFDSGSNTLSKYSSSTWTPTLVGQTSAGTTTYNAQTGYYTRIGNYIFLYGYIDISAATGTGNVLIGGLPFTILAVVNQFNTTIKVIGGASWTWPAGRTNICIIGATSTSTANISVTGTAANNNFLQMANAAATFVFSIRYQT